MGKAKRFNSYDSDVEDKRKIAQNYGLARQNLSGIGSSFRSSPLSPITSTSNPDSFTSGADNLGNHTATQNLDMNGNDIILSSDGDTKFNVVGANILFQCSNSGSSTEVFRISAAELQMAQNIDVNEKDLEKVNMITFKDDFNNNFISSTTTGVTYNVNSTDHHKFYSGLTALVTIDTADITLGADLDMGDNNINSSGNINFTNTGQVITTSTAGLLYQATNPDTHDFLVSAVSRFEVEQSKISLKEDTELTGGKVIKSSSSTEVGYQVTNGSGTVGSMGSLQSPVYGTVTTTASVLDTQLGNLSGNFGFIDTGAGNITLYFRQADGNWAAATLTRDTAT